MFFGSVPVECIEQLVKVVPFQDWREVYVCCSGSFRVEQALSSCFPELKIHSNDVSLYSSALAALVLDKPIRLVFKERLTFMEEALAESEAPFADRVAAVMVAHRMSRFAANNEYCHKHFAYYEQNFSTVLEGARAKLATVAESIKIEDYFAGDFLSHIDSAIAAGAGVIAFPPFTKGAYEGHFRFLRQSVDWDEPTYALYDPNCLEGLLDKLEAAEVPHCILTHLVFEGRKPIIEYVQGRKLPHYCYGSTTQSSLRHLFNKAVPFRYTPIDTTKLTLKSEVKILQAESKHLNFIKDVYLAKYIIHTSGLAGFFVFLDGMLVGGIIYGLQKHGIAGYKQNECIYLLSDVTISNENRLSKLIALLATSQTLIGVIERKLVQRIKVIITTVWTEKHCSMKYRGIYKVLKKTARVVDETAHGNILHAQKPNMIQYGSEVRQQTPQQIYRDWFKKYGSQKT